MMEFVATLSTLQLFEQSSTKEPSVDMTADEPTSEQLWDAALRSKGFVDPRTGEPSISALANKIGVGKTTISKMRQGIGTPRQETIVKVADALRVTPTEIARWVGQSRALSSPYLPPPVADLLDERERRAVDELIRVLAEPKLHTMPAADEAKVLEGRWGDRSVKPPRVGDLGVAADADE